MGFQVNHALRIHDIERVFPEAYYALQFSEARAVVISMNERVFDHITRVDARLKLFTREEIVMLPLNFAFSFRTSRGRDNLLNLTRILRVQFFPDSRFSDS